MANGFSFQFKKPGRTEEFWIRVITEGQRMGKLLTKSEFLHPISSDKSRFIQPEGQIWEIVRQQ